MKAAKRKLLTTLFTLLIFVTQVHTVIYNKALSTTATVTSSTPFATGYEAKWAIDGVVTFCNAATYCPGPHRNKMF